MKIILHQIGPFKHLELNLPDLGLVCITGATGKGKSSLLRAINWILSGDGKKDIVNLDYEKGKVYGQLEWGELYIYRQKKSDRLVVRNGNINLEDLGAQNYLINIFGANNVILASSYLVQKGNHPLIDLGISERLDLVQNLVWSLDNPNVYIDKIDSKIKTLTTEVKILQPEYQRDKIEIKSKRKAYKFKNYEPIEPIKEKINLYREKIKALEADVSLLNKNRGKLEHIQEGISKLRIIDHKPLLELEREKEILKSSLENLDKWNKFTSLQKELLQIPETSEQWESLDLSTTLNTESKIKDQLKICHKLGINYTQSDVSQVKTDIISDSQYYGWEEIIKKIEIIESNLNPPKLELEKLKEMESQSKSYKCPKCQTGLKLEADHLVVCNYLPVPPDLDLKSEIKKAEKYKSDCAILSDLKRDLPQLSKPRFSKKLLAEAQKLEFLSPPEVSSTQISNSKRRKIILDKLSFYGTVQPVETTSENLKSQLTLVQKQITEAERSIRDSKSREELLETQKKLTIEIESLSISEKKMHKYADIIKELEERVIILTEMKNILELEDKLKEKEKRLEALNTEVAMISKIKEKMIAVEYERLQDGINTINLATNEALTQLFEEPMEVDIQLYKEIKSTKIKKPNIHLKYNLNGKIFETTRLLSGGQLDRISMALLLAFSQLSNIPWLLIDEYFSSLNAEIREKVREVFRSKCKDKLVIIASHIEDLGDYDYVVNIEELI